MTDTNETQVEVTQADREAAIEWWASEVIEGDDHIDGLARAFALHRIQAEKRNNALAVDAEHLTSLRFLTQWLKDATGSRDESCGYVNGEQFQMMTMCPDPKALASAINNLPTVLAALEENE